MKFVAVIFMCILSLAAACSAQKTLKVDDVLGDWTGESKCENNDGFCHDEVVLYHFTRVGTETKKVHLVAEKLISGKWDVMYEHDIAFDGPKGTLSDEFPIPRTGGHGVVTYTIASDKMDGVMMIYPENKVGRRMHVERKKNR